MDSRNSGMFGSLTVCLVGGWGGLGWSEPAPMAVWMEMRRVGWLQRRIFLLDAGSTPPSKFGERSRSNQVGSR